MEYNKLKESAREKRISIKKLCEDMKMSFAGIKRGWENETIEFRKVREISDYFNVPITFWYTEETTKKKSGYVTQNEISTMQSEIAELKSSLSKLLKKP